MIPAVVCAKVFGKGYYVSTQAAELKTHLAGGREFLNLVLFELTSIQMPDNE